MTVRPGIPVGYSSTWGCLTAAVLAILSPQDMHHHDDALGLSHELAVDTGVMASAAAQYRPNTRAPLSPSETADLAAGVSAGYAAELR
jgi:hypothetical protein